MFAANENGFFLTFANGYQISVKWDSPRRGGFYRHLGWSLGSGVAAEVAVFRPDGGFVRLGESDDVLTGQKPDEVAALMAKYSSI
jgi:hypothetical protein